jgi:hypothetical protein
LQNKLVKIFVCFGLLITVFNPVLVFAQNNNQLPAYNAGVDKTIEEYLCTPSEVPDGHDLERCVNKFFRFSITFGAIVLVFFVVMAGYLYITGGEKGKGSAKTILSNSLIGVLILLGSYVLLNFINPTLVNFKVIQPPIFYSASFLSCEEVGFGEECLAEDGTVSTSNASRSSGSGIGYANCTGGLVTLASLSLTGAGGPSTKDICTDLGKKLVVAQNDYKSKLGGKYTFQIGQSINPGKGPSVSSCHYYNSPKSGNCADLSPRTVSGNTKPPNSDHSPWLELCKSLEAQGISVLVESIDLSGCGRRPRSKTNSTGAHFHVSLKPGYK